MSYASSALMRFDSGTLGDLEVEAITKRYRKSPTSSKRGIETYVSDGFRWAYSIADIAVHPGETADKRAVERSKLRSQLVEIIQQFATEGFAQSRMHDGKITRETAEAAISLFNALPPASAIPKISPDGEGGLLVVWASEGSPVVMVVENWVVHIAANATTPQAVYFENLRFDGEKIPNEIIDNIPQE